MSNRRGLQLVWAFLGCVALVAGTLGATVGADHIHDGGPFSANIDSEFRFHAIWYAAAGAAVLWSVPRIETRGTIVRFVCAVLFLAGCSRVISIVDEGRPDSMFLALMVAEFVIPIVVVPWQAAVARRAR